MHIKKDNDPDNQLGGFVSWCSVNVGGFEESYLSVDSALMAICFKRGVYPCQDCLKEVNTMIESGMVKDG